MNAIDQAQALRQQAIDILLAERRRIDEELAQFGHGQIKATLGKKRGRPLKVTEPSQPSLIGNSESAHS